MRVALISIAGQPRAADAATPLTLAGKSLARRQLDFALAAGAERVVALGDGAAAEAIALRHAAEAAGARFQAIRDAHSLPGAVRADDELLVLSPGLLPDTAEAPAWLEDVAVLTLPAANGVAAGFERIDLERAWAGALLAPGALVGRLDGLPPDSEPASALLRLALQARVPERRLPAEPLASGAWAIVGEDREPAAASRAWVKRNLPRAGPWSGVSRLAHLLLAAFGVRLLAREGAERALFGVLAFLVAGAIALAAYGLAAIGLALVALAALGARLAAGLAALRHAPFGRRRRRRLDLAAAGAILVDTALFACAALAIEGDWLHRLFPPLALVGLLWAVRPAARADAGALLGERAVLALLFAAASAVGLAEPAIMFVALALIALQGAQMREGSG